MSRWKDELNEELQMNKKQTETLKKSLSKMKKALMKSDEPLKERIQKYFIIRQVSSSGEH